MEKDILVKVEGLSKKFCKDLKLSLWYGIKDLLKNTNKISKESQLRKQEFWAIKDISFELRRGECLGLIGHNGAGKSTLLKILNGLLNPDEGIVEIVGRVGALIELGAGFNPILTGRENIYNNGAVLGFSKQEIEDKIEFIIDFSEIRNFIDMPVQNYSSGMKVRLGFAIASQMEPDVLIIDEVLAVGDLGFVLKCFNAIDDILPNTAIVFVSHSMPMISRICSQIVLIDKGVAIFQGSNVSKGIDLYYNKFLIEEKSNVVYTTNSLSLIEASVEGLNKIDNMYTIAWGANVLLNLKIQNIDLVKMPYISLAVYDKEQRAIAEIHPEGQEFVDINKGSQINLSFVINNLYLSKGIYNITLNASESIGVNYYYKIHKAVTLRVEHEKQMWTPFLLDSTIVP